MDEVVQLRLEVSALRMALKTVFHVIGSNEQQAAIIAHLQKLEDESHHQPKGREPGHAIGDLRRILTDDPG